jgi:hypothetical protein
MTNVLPLPLPQIGVVEAAQLPLRMEPLALLTSLEGELIVLAANERFRLRTGELLVLRSGGPLQLERATPGARVACFHAEPAWVTAFRALHGEPNAAEPRELDLVPAGTTLARRAAQLRGQRLPGRSRPRTSPPRPQRRCSRRWTAQGSRRPAARAPQRRHAPRDAIRAIADYTRRPTTTLLTASPTAGLSERQTARWCARRRPLVPRAEDGQRLERAEAAGRASCDLEIAGAPAGTARAVRRGLPAASASAPPYWPPRPKGFSGDFN